MLAPLLCVDDVEKKALKTLPKAVRDYYKSGADEEATLRRNRDAYRRLLIRPHCLRDVSRVETKTSFKLGNSIFEVPFPVGIAPTAFHRMANDEGEKATVRAASKAKTIMICSSLSTTALEDVAKAATKDAILWFQLYVYKDRRVTRGLVERAQASGFKAIVLTVDTPIFGVRREDSRNAFRLPAHLCLANFERVAKELSIMPDVKTGASGLWEYAKDLFDSSICWDDLRWLVETSPLPILIKGVMREDDALKALECGASGIIVSNHGGRQLDFAPGTIEALPEVVRAVGGRVPVFVDGGVRTGNDVFKALALGASAVFVGRPVLWGLTVGGTEGVRHVLDILKTELEYAMKLSGVTTVGEIRNSRNLVVREEFFASKL